MVNVVDWASVTRHMKTSMVFLIGSTVAAAITFGAWWVGNRALIATMAGAGVLMVAVALVWLARLRRTLRGG